MSDEQSGQQPVQVPPELVARRLLGRVTALTEELATTEAYADLLEAQAVEYRATIAALQEELIAATSGEQPDTEGNEPSTRP